MLRGEKFGYNYCPFCSHIVKRKIKIREDFEKWYLSEGSKLESILPNPMPTIRNLDKMLRKIRKAKNHD